MGNVGYNWWQSLNSIGQDFNEHSLFLEAEVVTEVLEKAIEPAYNYYGIEPERISDHIGIVLFSLFFYLIYTILYGFGLMFMIEGWGIKI